ncbi:MAG: PocR ligand-binding domain-containing protein [Anaerolineae bacterium]|nr:PocR ligand-binding domain-containing protein [Anaerolineae bacterium]
MSQIFFENDLKPSSTLSSSDQKAVPSTTPNESQQDDLHLTLLKQAPLFTWVVDTNLQVKHVFGQILLELGIDPQHLSGLSLLEFFQRQSEYLALEAHHKALSGEPARFTHIFQEKTFDCHVTPQLNAQGHVIGVMGWGIDITEQKRIESVLQQRLMALTHPLDVTTPPRFEDLFNIDEIQTIQDAFSEATGVASIITEVDGTPITHPSNFCRLCLDIRKTDIGLANCMHSDAELGKKNPHGPILQPCLSGTLWDGGTSITVGNHHIANWLVGQVLDDSQNESKILAYGEAIGADMDGFKEALKGVTRMSREQFEKIANALFLIARQLSMLALQNVQQARFISQLKQVEEELDSERNLLRTLIYALPDAIYAKDINGRKTLANHADLRHIGAATEEEVLGKTDAELFPLDLAACFMSDEENIYKNGIPLLNREEYITSSDGTARWILTSKVPLHDKKGNVVGLVGIGRDITARKKADEEIHRLNVELEQRVLERTAELEAALHEIESFSYSVSHDLRAPLRGINGFGQILLEEFGDQLGPQGNAYLHRIRAASERMAQLIDDMLKLSRITRSEMQREPVNLSLLAAGILGELQSDMPQRHVKTVIQPDLWVKGDSNLICIMLENLLNNAWKFTSKRNEAQIEVGKTLIENEIIHFVRDNGAGFDMAFADKLFSPFQRMHSPTEFEGTGIGLATVQRIVNRHGGKVWAKSALDQGTTIFFTLKP